MVYPSITAVVVGKEIMMVSCVLATPKTTITVGIFEMNGISEALREYAPLKGKILHSIKRTALINTPTCGTMINDYIVVNRSIFPHYLNGIIFPLFFVSKTAANKTDYNIVCSNLECIVFEANTISGSSLAGNGDIVPGNLKG